MSYVMGGEVSVIWASTELILDLEDFNFLQIFYLHIKGVVLKLNVTNVVSSSVVFFSCQ